jgi:hypothetical protein
MMILENQLASMYSELENRIDNLQKIQGILGEKTNVLHTALSTSTKTLVPQVEDCNVQYLKLVTDISACEEKQQKLNAAYEKSTATLNNSGIANSVLQTALSGLMEEKENAEKKLLYELTQLFNQLRGEKQNLHELQRMVKGECAGTIQESKLQITRCANVSKLFSEQIKHLDAQLVKIQQYHIDTVAYAEDIAQDPVKGTVYMVSMEREKIQSTLRFLERIKSACTKTKFTECSSTIATASENVQARIKEAIRTLQHLKITNNTTLRQIAEYEHKTLLALLPH